MPRWLISVLTASLGIGVGLVYGLLVNPVKFVDTTPASLRGDFRTDYVLMVAEAYQADHDTDLAGRRLAIFGTDTPASLVEAALEAAGELRYSSRDISQLQELLRAMQASVGPTPAAGGAP